MFLFTSRNVGRGFCENIKMVDYLLSIMKWISCIFAASDQCPIRENKL